MRDCLVADDQIHIAETSFLVLDRSFETFFDIVFRKPRKAENTASRHDGARHRNVRIFRGRAYKYNISLLDCLQNAIALRLIPTMTLVQKQIGALAVHT